MYLLIQRKGNCTLTIIYGFETGTSRKRYDSLIQPLCKNIFYEMIG